MTNPRSWITADVSTNWPQMLMRLNVIGVRRLGERITMASDLFSFMTSPLSQSHVFTSCMQASMRARACMWSVGGKVMYN